MDPETQVGTDLEAKKEQARQAMLRAQTGNDGSTDAEVEDDDTDEVAGDSADDADQAEDDDDSDADAADEEEESEADEDPDEVAGDSAADENEGEPTPGKGKRKKLSKIAKLQKEISDLKAQAQVQTVDVSAEVERVLAAKAESDKALADLRADQDEDAKRAKKIRDYVHELRGSDDELHQLTRDLARTKVNDPLSLSPEERQAYEGKQGRVNQILAARDALDIASEYADNELKGRVGLILGEFAKTLPGVNKNFHNELAFAPAIQHIYDSAYERGQSEGTKEIARLTKALADSEGKLLTAKAQKRAPASRIADGGASAKPAPKPKSQDEMTPRERLEDMGAIDKNGRPVPDFRQKLKLGQVRLVG